MLTDDSFKTGEPKGSTMDVTEAMCDERRCALRKAIDVAVMHEREMREAALRVRDEALVSQAREYERRLSDLNHNMQLILDERHTFVTRELYERFQHEYNRFRDETRTHQTTVATWGAAAALMLGLLQFALHFFLK